MATREITGRHVLIGTVAAFSVIVGVNFLMAWQAISTFPGVEAKNSYAASQIFEAERSAQLALGWNVAADVSGSELRVRITDPEGAPIRVASLTGVFGWATHTGADQTPDFRLEGGEYVAAVDVTPGNWNLRMNAVAQDGTPFRQRIPILVR